MTIEQDAYLREPHPHQFSASLKEVNNVITPFNFPGTAGRQVIHMARMMERKIESLDYAQKEQEFLHGQNASLTKKIERMCFFEAWGSYKVF